MDPNHWNTYNNLYGHSTPGLNLSHTLSPHGSLSGRSVSSISGVNYPGLDVPIIGTMPPLAPQSSHKSMSLQQGQLVFDPQVRVTSEQQSSTINRYEAPTSKTAFSRDNFTGNHQILEAAAARMMGGTNFSAANLPNLYSQFGSLLSHISGPAVTSASTSPGSGSINVSKINQGQLHEPPPAHSSNTARSIHRTPQTADLFYSRSTESIMPSNNAPMTIHSPGAFGKLGSTVSQHQTSPPSSSIHRQTQVHPIQFNSQCDIEDLSSNHQQLYGSYANVPDTQEFSPTHIQQEISYEAVSPAPTINNEGTVHVVSSGGETGTFSIVQFPDLASLTSEHAHQLAENDFRLKIESSRVNQPALQDNLLSQHQKMLKEINNPAGSTPRQNLWAQIGTPSLSDINLHHGSVISQPISLVSQSGTYTSSSMPQNHAPIPVQALADSTTKPKKIRNRKKKTENITTNPNTIQKKSTSEGDLTRTLTQQSSHILNMPPTSNSNISSLSINPSQLNQSNLMHNQQTFRTISGSNHYSNRDSQRSHTPSGPQNFSIQEDPNRAYTSEISPKSSSEASHMRSQTQRDFAPVGRVLKHPGSGDASSDSLQSNNLYRSNIPEQAQHIQSFRPGFMSDGDQRGSPMTEAFTSKAASNQIVNTVGQSPLNSRPVSVEQPISMPYDALESQDGHYQLELGTQPFLEQLVAPLSVQGNFNNSNYENGEVVLTTLVNPTESARIQQQQTAQIQNENDTNFRPTYHGEAVHEIRHISHLGMEVDQFGHFFDQNQQGLVQHQQQIQEQEESDPNLTFVPSLYDDDELSHFSQPIVAEAAPKVVEPTVKTKEMRDSFQNSFLSYLQGAKQETLSSVSSATLTKKPTLPKYIPEPRRPRPPPPPPKEVKEPIAFSSIGKLEQNQKQVTNKVKDLLSNLSDSSNDSSSFKKEPIIKDNYSIQRTSELAVKITIPKSAKKNKFGIISDNSLLKQSMKKTKEAVSVNMKGKKKRNRYSEEYDIEDTTPAVNKVITQREKSPTPPPRTSFKRKAKDTCMERTKKKKGKYAESDDSDDEILRPINDTKTDDSDYDSDKDPVWMPFEVDLKQQGVDYEEQKRKRYNQKRHRQRNSSQNTRLTSPPVVKPNSQMDARNSSSNSSSTASEEGYKIGQYIIEKKDLHNYDTYPIWRIEKDNMIRKFELRVVDGVPRHFPSGTFSTWNRFLERQFNVLTVNEVYGKMKSEPLSVEVLEKCRPKPPNDIRLEEKYEHDPLIETFNIYLQVFLSHALEPTFLKAILETNEKFYVDALNNIDKMIELKCIEIGKITDWQKIFKECLHRCPLMKEIDRPNLKQPCQACENSIPPTIKSVLFSGNSYDRFLLTPIGGVPETAQEFMIGKTAAHYVRPYHTLYHYKYWLRQRCDAKVKMIKESNANKNVSNEEVLDKCLENRTWVLKLFDSLIKLLRFEETSR